MILPLSWPTRTLPSRTSMLDAQYGTCKSIYLTNSNYPLCEEWIVSLASLPTEINWFWWQTTAVHSPWCAFKTKPSSPLWSQQWTEPLAPPLNARPSSSKVTQLNLVYGYFCPNVPFLKSFLVASAGFQNYKDRVVTATNLKSFCFLDH
jgi:hypothetical protein